MTIYSGFEREREWIYPLKMVIFHSQVSLPEGKSGNNMSSLARLAPNHRFHVTDLAAGRITCASTEDGLLQHCATPGGDTLMGWLPGWQTKNDAGWQPKIW